MYEVCNDCICLVRSANSGMLMCTKLVYPSKEGPCDYYIKKEDKDVCNTCM